MFDAYLIDRYAQPSPAGWLRGLDEVLGQVATTNLSRDPDDPYDPDDDEPFRVIEQIRLSRA